MKIDQLTFEEMKKQVDQAAAESYWLVFAGHDISSTGTGQTTRSAELEKLCKYMTEPANGIWPATVLEVSEYIIRQRKK